MKVLITPQFNASMLSLSKPSQQEASVLFSTASAMDLAQLQNSPLLTRVESTDEPIYTLRGNLVRIFCSLADENSLLFLDIEEVRHSALEQPVTTQTEITLFGRRGDPVAYLATKDDNTIYSFAGEPFAYLLDTNIYGFNGKHLGWFEDGIIWNHKGRRVGFTKSTCPVFTRFEPFKGFKRFRPFKAFAQRSPFKPVKTFLLAGEDLREFLSKGAK